MQLKRYRGQDDLAPLLAKAVNEALAGRWLPLSADPQEAARMMRTWLSQGEFLLLLDGLNEVPSDYRTEAVEALRGLLAAPTRWWSPAESGTIAPTPGPGPRLHPPALKL